MGESGARSADIVQIYCVLLATCLSLSKVYGIILGVSVAAPEALLSMFSYYICDGQFQSLHALIA